jgi:hypothetical protein
MPEPSSPPTLYEWAGGMPALRRLTGVEAVVDTPMPKWDWGVPGGPYRGPHVPE